MPEQTLPDTIQAGVDPTAITKVTRFFDASTHQIMSELLQNARRAGAKNIRVETPRDEIIRIIDDGRGIADPQTLLSFGRSCWNEETMIAEDPAGMGVFSLARRRARIASRPLGNGAAAAGWEVNLEPEHFVGELEAAVSASTDAPLPHGTMMEFSVDETRNAIHNIVANATRYYPLPVTFNGVELHSGREKFLGKAVRVEEWSGVLIGVHHWMTKTWVRGEINFHGHQIEVGELPIVTALPDDTNRVQTWWVKIDVIDGAQLELVLPARKQVVRNNYLQQLLEVAEKAIYATIAQMDEPPSLDHGTWKRAHELGVKLPAAKPQLHLWTPRPADTWENETSRHDDQAWTQIDDNSRVLLMKADLATCDQQTLAHALGENHMRHRVYAFEERLESYAWYRTLKRITKVDFRMRWASGLTHLVSDMRRSVETLPDERPEQIQMLLQVRDPDGTETELALTTPATFVSDEASDYDQIDLVLAKDAGISTETLTDLMIDGFFKPCDDADADSPSTQRSNYRRGCREKALKMTGSSANARRETITDLIEQYVAQEISHDEDVTVHIHNGSIEVDVHEVADAAQA